MTRGQSLTRREGAQAPDRLPRLEHEAPTGKERVGKRQPIGCELEIAQQEQVQVEGTRAMALPAEHPPVFDLDRLAENEQGLRLQLGTDPERGVQEVGLVEDLADR